MILTLKFPIPKKFVLPYTLDFGVIPVTFLHLKCNLNPHVIKVKKVPKLITFLYLTTYDLSFNFRVMRLSEFSDHSAIAIQIKLPSPSQCILNLRSVTKFSDLPYPTKEAEPIPMNLNQPFTKAIAQKDIDLAFKLWMQDFERTLLQIADISKIQPVSKGSAKRGQICFHEQRAHPKIIRHQASTLQTRKIWQAYCRLKEILIAAPGTRRDRTIENLSQVTSWLPESHANDFAAMIDSQNFPEALAVLDLALEAAQRHDRAQRILQWKRNLRSDQNKPFAYLRAKAASKPVKVSTVDNQLTANIHDRLSSISKVWKEIYSQHSFGEPSLRSFMEEYGSTMKRSVVKLVPIQSTAVIKALDQMSNSSPGLDQVSVLELKTALRWSPQLLHALVQMLDTIESNARWPKTLAKGVVAFIPKDPDNPQPKADEFRPITILSTLYRLWSAFRHSELADQWFPHWRHTSSYGGKKSRSADQLALDVCMQIEKAIQDGKFAAGLSFDLQKCFDTVPYMLALDVFAARGADLRVVASMKSFYLAHQKHFRLDGHHTHSFQPSCGIVQGCPLSMLLLTSLVTCWSEKSFSNIPSSIGRSYADDLSIVAEGRSKQAVKDQLNLGYKSTQKNSSLAGMKISKTKTFSFGAVDFKKSVTAVPEHKTVFRLVGCSVKTTSARSWTPLEQQRFSNWKQTVQRIRVLPVSWQRKSQIIQSMMPKLTFGQGMHALHVSRDNSRAMKAVVMRTLLDADNYNSSPIAVFALLTPPSIDPIFSLDLAAFNLFRRTYISHRLISHSSKRKFRLTLRTMMVLSRG